MVTQNDAAVMRHFPSVFLGFNIFCHAYISLYRFLYIFCYITVSNYASMKSNWYKSSVARATNAIGLVVLWRHDSSFPTSPHLLPIFYWSWGGSLWAEMKMGRNIGASAPHNRCSWHHRWRRLSAYARPSVPTRYMRVILWQLWLFMSKVRRVVNQKICDRDHLCPSMNVDVTPP